MRTRYPANEGHAAGVPCNKAPMSRSAPPPRLRLIGESACLPGDGRTLALERKDALALAYLAIEGPTPRAALASLLWPDVDLKRARANLRQRLFRLRQSVGFDLVDGNVVARIRPEVQTDLADTDPDPGELLSGIGENDAGDLADWLNTTREQRRAARREALARDASQLEDAGQLHAALHVAQKLIDADPTSEHGHRRLMRLHYLRGDRAAALSAFDRCCDVLERVLGVAPEPETEALRASVEMGTLDSSALLPLPLPVAVLRPPRLIGRDREWHALHNAWEIGGASLIAGDAGMGKSRLIGDFARARPDALALGARHGDARVPHALLSRLLRELIARLRVPPPHGVIDELSRLLPELGRTDAMGHDTERTRFVNAVEALLRQARAEGLSGLLIDDLQFSDAASIEMLHHLAAADIGLRWVVAYRPVELCPEAQTLHDELMAHDLARLHRLRPLVASQIAELVDSLALVGLDGTRLAPALERHTGGNPLYLLETIKLMLVPGAQATRNGSSNALALPRAVNVTQLIEQRIARLSVQAVKLARCAAVAGADFSSELAAHVLGLRTLDLADPWAELESAQVLRDGGFTHDLIFEAARDSVPAPIARQLHAEIAAFLEARQAEPARVAQHWIEAGLEVHALPSLLAAGDRAAAAWRSAEEGRLLQRAAQIASTHGIEEARIFAWLLRAHRAHERADLGSIAHREVLDALECAARSPLELAGAHLARAELLSKQGDGVGAEDRARRGLAALDGQSDRAANELRVDLSGALASSLNNQDRLAEAIDIVRACEPQLLALDDRPRQIEHYGNLGVLLDAANRHAQAEHAHRHAIALARAAADAPSELILRVNLAINLAETGRFAAAIEPLQEAYRIREAAPELRSVAPFLEASLGDVLRCVGRYTESIDWLTRALTVVSEFAPHFAAGVHNHLALTWLHLGQPARAYQQLQQVAGVTEAPPSHRAKTQLLLARCALMREDAATAAVALAAARVLTSGAARYATQAQAALLAARLADPEAAYRGATQVVLEAGQHEMQGVRMIALACAARSALACGQTAAAVGHAVEALALWPEHMPDDFYIGEVWLAAVETLRASGDPRADALLASACAWIRDVARDSVPDAFRDSFLNRNPSNRALLASASLR